MAMTPVMAPIAAAVESDGGVSVPPLEIGGSVGKVMQEGAGNSGRRGAPPVVEGVGGVGTRGGAFPRMGKGMEGGREGLGSG